MRNPVAWSRLLVIVVVGCARIAAAAEFVVATDGDDANPGTFERPWATLQHAASSVEPGDVVLVRGGVYRQMFSIERSGTPERWITFRNYQDEQVNIWWAVDLSQPDQWIDRGHNVWQTRDGSLRQGVNYDVATIWHDDRSHWSHKKLDPAELEKQWDFYHNLAAGRLEVYSTANPATLAQHIEVPRSPAASPWQFVTRVTGNYILMDGFHYKYMNVHGLQVASGAHHFIFRNGSITHGGGANISPTREPRVRWGDSVDVTRDVHHVWFEHSSFGEFPDGTLTNQGYDGNQHHIHFRNNDIFRSTNGIHCWLGVALKENANTSLTHAYYEGNTIRDICQGWYEDQAVMVGGIQIVLKQDVEGQHIYIRDNLFRDCGSTRHIGDNWKGVNGAINLDGGDITVAGNIILGGPSEGIHIQGIHQRFTGTIANNMIGGTAWSGINLADGSSTDAATIVNNTLAGCGDRAHAALRVGRGASPRVFNNIVASNNAAEVESLGGVFDFNCYEHQAPIGPHDVSADPLLTPRPGLRFDLDLASPCIDAGTTERAAGVDLYQVPRPQGAAPDIGAVEMGKVESSISAAWLPGELALRVFPEVAEPGSRIVLRPSGFRDDETPRLSIHDAAGRLIAQLAIVTEPDAVNIWDASDACHRPLPPGEYRLRLSAGDRSAQATLSIRDGVSPGPARRE